MAIFRGIGGAGDSTTDATVQAVTEQAVNAANSATNAASSASSAASSAAAASTSEGNAAASAVNAATSATAAASSETAASASESAAAASETAAAASETNAAASEAAAATSETNAAASETAAAASESAAATSETNAASSASAASTSATAAASSASAAATSETNAAASESAAATSETNAATSETNAATSAAASATSATASANSATAAAASETAAATSETNAASSASDAASSATAAASSASAASTSETNAASSATAASASETAAASSETNAAASATAALASETAAAASETAAATSESNAASSASAASSSASAAATSAAAALVSENAAAASETNAATSESNAATSETNAANSATAAAGSASAANTSATAASASASAASTSETNASASESAAASSAAAAAASYDSFDDRYLGTKASDPSVDNDGNALLTGALYFDTTNSLMKVYNGSTWVAAYASAGGALLNTNNLSDVSNVSTSRTNLGLGTTDDVVFGSLETTDGLTVGGDLTVNGTLTTVNTENLAVSDNMIYLNEGSTITNPDLGWAGNYNDGTYAHAGVFRDATDGKFKFYDGYTPEPGTSIDTSHASYSAADVEAGTFYGALSGNATTATTLQTARTIGLSGDVSGSASFNGSANITITATVADDSHNHIIGNVDGLQAALDLKAPLASPALTGTPTAPTAAVGTNTTQVATTAFVNAEIANDAPTKTGGGASGTWGINVTGSSGSTTGNAATATKLATARTISLTGDVTGSASFDGSANASITATVADDSHNHIIGNVDGLQAALDAKQAASTALTTSTTFGGDVSGTYNSIVVADDSHNHIISNVDGLQTALDGKAASTHYHDRIYNESNPSSYYLKLSSSNELEFFNSSGSITDLYLQYSGGVNSLRGPAGHIILNAGNYNSYSPTLTGGGASGTWGISITGNADTTDGLHVHSGRNNEANKIVRTDGNGYIQAGWINSLSGATTSTITRITASNDEYLRYVTPATFRSQITDPYYPTKTGGGASGTWGINITGSAGSASSASTSSQVTINYNNDSNSTYQMLWGSGNSVYGTGGIYCNPSTDYLYANSFYCGDWFRSSGASGWYNQSYGGGIYMVDTTWVRVYASKAFYVENQIAATGNVTAYYSDERLKTKVADIDSALDKVKSLTGFYYVENALAKSFGYNNDKQQVALSAQDVKAVMPEAVSLAAFDMDTKEDGSIVSKSGEDYLTVDYARLVPLLVEAIKEQDKKIEKLEALVEQLINN